MLRYVNKTHADQHYEQQLKALIERLAQMMTLDAELTAMGSNALKTSTSETFEAKRVDKEINALEVAVEKGVHTLLSRHSPQLVELRFILSALKIAGSLERIGDHAKNTVKRLGRAKGLIQNGIADSIGTMLEHTSAILKELHTLLLEFTPEKARAICSSDDAIDTIYKQTMLNISSHIAKGTLDSDSVSHALFIAKNVERMADHATSVARELYYVHTGERLKNNQDVVA